MTQKNIAPDLKAMADGQGVKIPSNVRITWIENARGKPALMVRPTKKDFSEADEWVVVLTGIEFTDGVIEFDALGQSGPPQSNFLGVAFRYIDERTHAAVYLRPFNFRAEDAERKIHAVQYISHPQYHWFDLRRDRPGQYEQPIVPAPDGDAWPRIDCHRTTEGQRVCQCCQGAQPGGGGVKRPDGWRDWAMGWARAGRLFREPEDYTPRNNLKELHDGCKTLENRK